MSSRTSTALPSVAHHGDEVTRDGVVYRYNATPPGVVGSTGAARWETVLDRNLDIVTKDTDQSYFTTESTQAQSVSKKNGLLSVPEVDSNFVNLKKAVLAIERELTADGGILNRVDINASNFGNVEGSVNNIIQTKANLASPQFTGTPEAPTVTSNNSSTTLATTAFVQNLLGQLQNNLVPQGATTTLGTQASPFQTLFVSQDIVPTSLTGSNFLVDFNGVPQQVNATSVNLGSPSAAFNNIYRTSITHKDAAKLILKIKDKQGIIKIGGPVQTVYDFVKKYQDIKPLEYKDNNPQVTSIKLDTTKLKQIINEL